MLKAKISTALMFKNFDPDRPPVIIVYASKWTVLAALIQENDGVYYRVAFDRRTLKPNDLNYGTVEKEVTALFHVFGCMLYYTSFTRDHCVDPTFHLSVVDAISRAQQDIMTTDFLAVKLDGEGEEMQKRREGDPRYRSSEYHPEGERGRDDDCTFPAKGLPTQDINAIITGESE